MLILVTLVMLNVWAIPADEVLSPNINILEELGKITTMEKRMKSMENEMERLKTENEGNMTSSHTYSTQKCQFEMNCNNLYISKHIYNTKLFY